MKLYLPFISLLLLLLSGCGKEAAFKNPTAVTFSIEKAATSIGGPDLLDLDLGYIILGSISIHGQRTGAENFTFSRTFEDGLMLSLVQTTFSSDLQFDLPQGNYDKITVEFETYDGGDGSTNLFVQGMYTYQNPQKQPSNVELHLMAPRTFEVDITNTLGQTALKLDEAVEETPTIVLDPKMWFDGVMDSDMSLANISIVNNNQLITVSPSSNSAIFSVVDSQVGTAITCKRH